MRPDMFKVLVERPRLRNPLPVGSAYPRGRIKNRFERDWDDAPRALGMRFPHAVKHLNENLAPLQRFLRSRVGRPWSRVRSEIAEHLSMGSAVQKHVVDHLKDFVCEHVELVDGKPFGRRYGARFALEGRWRPFLYVCPRTGLLRQVERLPRRPRPEPAEIVEVDDWSELRRIDGVWQHVRFVRLPTKPEARARCFDVLLRSHVTPNWFAIGYDSFKKFYGRTDRYAFALREPGRRELALAARAPATATRRRS